MTFFKRQNPVVLISTRLLTRSYLTSLLALSLFVHLSAGCAVETKRTEEPHPAQTAEQHAAEIPTQNVNQTLQYPATTVDEPTIVLKDQHGNIINSKMSPPPTVTTPALTQAPAPLPQAPMAAAAAMAAPKTEAHGRVAGPVPAQQSLGWLRNGNSRFRKGFLRKDGQSMKDIARLSKGQKPHAIIVSCSDSRVPPEVVFDQKLGEIFVVRTAGESLDSSAIASIEYAVEHLGSNLIVVMGHESCGAVKATLSYINDKADLGSPYLNKLASNLRPRIENMSARAPASEGLVMEGWENAKGAAKELYTKSEIIRRAIESGDVKMTSALYHLGSGEVEWSNSK